VKVADYRLKSVSDDGQFSAPLFGQCRADRFWLRFHRLLGNRRFDVCRFGVYRSQKSRGRRHSGREKNHLKFIFHSKKGECHISPFFSKALQYQAPNQILRCENFHKTVRFFPPRFI
jgi:hypothetical protein